MLGRSRQALVAVFTIALALALSSAGGPALAQGRAMPAKDLPANALRSGDLQAYVDAMQPGWNLGNTFDSTGPDETSWGNPRVTREFLQKLRAQGYRSIRIPVTWFQHMGPAPDYTIDPAYLDRVEQVVDWALQTGFYVMVNMHHDSGTWVIEMPAKHDEVMARFRAGWTQIADRLRDKPERLMLESINEPRFSGDWNADSPEYFQWLDELNTAFHQIVRDSGGRNSSRPLVLPTLTCSPSQARLDELKKTIDKLHDNRIIATVHYYGYYPFSVNIAGGTRFDDAARQDLTDAFDRVHDTLVAAGIPVVVGEYGLLGFDKFTGTIEQGEKLKFFEYLGYYARRQHLTTMLWDNGQHFDRVAYQWRDTDLYDVMRTSWVGRSSTASSDLVFVDKDAEPADQTVTLNLNGNQLVRIEYADRVLRAGRDYVLNGDQLTFRAGLLASLTAGGDYGTNAVLTARFSAGSTWKFEVVVADRPLLAAATGASDAFAVPTAFHGDRLATMEAVYPDGSNAGPADWTSYKEFGASFLPSYDTGEIRLLPAFFAELHDGTVNLRFHFWSGEVVDYTLTKAGTSITGAPAE
ncbi:cellulase family glycosylhydrolase [Actinopolymorpha singaporensis]